MRFLFVIMYHSQDSGETQEHDEQDQKEETEEEQKDAELEKTKTKLARDKTLFLKDFFCTIKL